MSLMNSVQLECLADMPNLGLLHLQTLYMTQEEVAENLAFALPTVQIVGLGSAFWSVEREDESLSLRHWASREVALRSADTLGEAGDWCVLSTTNALPLLKHFQGFAISRSVERRRHIT
jgi:hypothetical protein